jgi:hypothetical protein
MGRRLVAPRGGGRARSEATKVEDMWAPHVRSMSKLGSNQGVMLVLVWCVRGGMMSTPSVPYLPSLLVFVPQVSPYL